MVTDEMMMMMIHIDDNIITDIISRLPADSIIQCKRVCKTWRTLIDELLQNSTFLRTHARRFIASSASAAEVSSSSYGFLMKVKLSDDGAGNSHSTSTQFHIGEYYYHDNVDDGESTIFNYNPLKFRSKQITTSSTTDPTNNNNNLFPMDSDEHNLLMDWSLVGSCNGLICLVSNLCNNLENYEVCICNPVTREYVNLMPYFKPSSKRRWFRKMESVVATGFGYHPCTNEYKVVRMSQKPWKVVEEKVTVCVYTLGSTGGSKWRNKGEFPHHEFKCYKKTSPTAAGLLFNGALHWTKLSAGGEIVSFDLADEEFRIIPPPPPHPDHIEDDNDQLVVLGGSLCVIRRRDDNDNDNDNESIKEIWVMNNEDYSWTMKFNIPPINPTATTPVALLKDKMLLSYDDDCMKFTCYDPKTSTTITSTSSSTTIDDHNLGADHQPAGPVNWQSEMIPYSASFVSLKALGVEKVNVKRKRRRSDTEAALSLLHFNQELEAATRKRSAIDR